MDDDPRVGAQLGHELAVADVDGVHDLCAPRSSSTWVKPPVDAPASSTRAGTATAAPARAPAFT